MLRVAPMLGAGSLLLLLLVAGPHNTIHAAECHGKPDPKAQQNLLPIETDEPVLVKTVPNGKLFHVGRGDDVISVVHLYGTPFDWGYAQGQLMPKAAPSFMNDVWKYLELQVEQALNGTVHNLKPWFAELVADVGLDVALDITTDLVANYTPKDIPEEMAGLAKATGIDLKMIQRVHMIGELTKGSCSMYGASGAALPAAGSTKLLQLRALDWDVDGPFQNYPQITVYHPSSSEYGHAWANIGWTAWLGSITGMSSQQMAISEIGVSFPDDSFGNESRRGVPFTYILRDMMQYDATLAAAKQRMTDAHRTCDLILGVGDGKPDGGFVGVQYSASVANFQTPDNMMPENATWHPRMQDLVYYGMDWLCPNYSEVLARQLKANYGNITPETTIRDITAIVQTGDLHVAIYDLTNNILHTANARKDSVTAGGRLAYDRAFVKIDMNKVFAEK